MDEVKELVEHALEQKHVLSRLKVLGVLMLFTSSVSAS